MSFNKEKERRVKILIYSLIIGLVALLGLYMFI